MILVCVLIYVLFIITVYAILKAGSDADDEMEQLYMRYKEHMPEDK